MPILSYFVVVGAALVGLLFAADAMLPNRGPLRISSEFHGTSLALHAEPAGSSRTADIEPDLPGMAPAPDMKSAAIKLAREDGPRSVAVPKIEPVNASVASAEPVQKKRKPVVRPREDRSHIARRREWRQHYAQADDPGWNWGSNNRSSWRNNGGRNESWRSDPWRSDPWRSDPWRNESWRNDSWQNGWR
jgi:hypothetical protein